MRMFVLSPHFSSPRRSSVGLTAFQWFSYPYEFESRPADSNALTRAEIGRCPGAFDLPPALMSDVSPPRADSRAGFVPRTPNRASSKGLVLANSEADGLALAPEPSAIAPHRGNSRKMTARPCASLSGPVPRSSAISPAGFSSAPAPASSPPAPPVATSPSSRRRMPRNSTAVDTPTGCRERRGSNRPPDGPEGSPSQGPWDL